MAPTLSSLGIDQLSVPERVSLVHAIWDSIAADQSAVPLSDSQQQEILRRAAKHDGSPQPVVPWEQVRDEALARLKR